MLLTVTSSVLPSSIMKVLTRMLFRSGSSKPLAKLSEPSAKLRENHPQHILNFLGVIHLVRAHKGGGGVTQKRTPCIHGEKGLHVEVRTQKRPFFARVL